MCQSMTTLHRVPTAYSILVSQDSLSANPNRTNKACAYMPLPLSRTKLPLDLTSPEGKSWHVPINMTSLHRVPTACTIFVSQDSLSANPNRMDKAADVRKIERQRQLTVKRMTKVRAHLTKLGGEAHGGGTRSGGACGGAQGSGARGGEAQGGGARGCAQGGVAW